MAIENIEVKSSTPSSRVSRITNAFFLVFVLGGGSFATSWNIWNLIQSQRDLGQLYKDASNRFDERFNPPRFPDFDPQTLNSELNLQNVDLPQRLSQLQRKTDSLNETFFEVAKRPNTETANIETTFRQIATEHLFDYLQLFNIHSPEVKAVSVTESGRPGVRFGGEFYDLSNPLQFQALFAVTSLKLEAATLDKEINQTTSQTIRENLMLKRSRNILNQKAAGWLKNQDIQLGFGENGALLATPTSLADFARTIQLINNLGYPIPRTGIFGPNPNYGGIYVGKSVSSSESTIIDYLNPYGSLDALVHEAGHYVSDVSASVNPQFSQAAFEMVVIQAETENLPAVRDPKNVHYFLAAPQRNDRKEQYAELFAQYVKNGKAVRDKLTKLRSDDPAAARILEAEYNFFKMLFQGKEFVEGGYTQEELNEQIITKAIVDEPKIYKTGQQIIIVDNDTKHPGILLRNMPAGQVSPDSPAVFNHDVVKIVDGPFVIKRQYVFNEKTLTEKIEDVNWWRVTAGSGTTGWVDEKWLGSVYQPQSPKP